MITIKNNKLEVEIDQLGAQITHVVDAKGSFDYIWNGKAWKRHAPILFPSIGRSNDDHYVVDGQTYPMPQHGFARDLQWENVRKADDQVLLQLKASPKTKEYYPFDFTLQVDYKLVGNQLLTKYSVTNNDKTTMPYALGSHPGFNIPIDDDGVFEDYTLTFGPHPKEIQQLGINPAPFRDGTKAPFTAVDKDNVLKLDHSTFDNGLIILDAKKIETVTLRSDQTAHEIKLNVKHFPYITLWTMENATEPYLCIEPFAGLPDQASDQPTDWANKKGNNFAEPGETQSFEYGIEFS
ncbi:aldose 1-epimerase family protein [Pediococcus ethanolidurans]|uniref:aldose 1-epimerase family protein n=1 Tax=Pediococcus ethanolidurans TaxID=319653 RepID=UPI001C1F1B75|nr:aldose 1-epimerase family protein [Pediococcus ethanolidurans]MBU7555476.1 aldose 1-epimerase family protein [Pediococcus ethanolidurans]